MPRGAVAEEAGYGLGGAVPPITGAICAETSALPRPLSPAHPRAMCPQTVVHPSQQRPSSPNRAGGEDVPDEELRPGQVAKPHSRVGTDMGPRVPSGTMLGAGWALRVRWDPFLKEGPGVCSCTLWWVPTISPAHTFLGQPLSDPLSPQNGLDLPLGVFCLRPRLS